jgi:hypothetical protein
MSDYAIEAGRPLSFARFELRTLTGLPCRQPSVRGLACGVFGIYPRCCQTSPGQSKKAAHRTFLLRQGWAPPTINASHAVVGWALPTVINASHAGCWGGHCPPSSLHHPPTKMPQLNPAEPIFYYATIDNKVLGIYERPTALQLTSPPDLAISQLPSSVIIAHATRAAAIFDHKRTAGGNHLLFCPASSRRCAGPPGKGCFRHAGQYKHVVWLGFTIDV